MDEGEDLAIVLGVCVILFITIVLIPVAFLVFNEYARHRLRREAQQGHDEHSLCKHGVSVKERREARERLINKGIVDPRKWDGLESQDSQETH